MPLKTTKNVLVIGLLAICACGESRPKLVLGPSHLATELNKPDVREVHGRYRVSGNFAGSSSNGVSLTIEQPDKSAVLTLRRTSANGTVVAIGTGTVMGDQLYVAWEVAPAKVLTRGLVVELYVTEFKPTGIEGYRISSSTSGFSGGQTAPPATLAIGAEAHYPLLKQQTVGADEQYEMTVKRYADQLDTAVAGPRASTARGTSMLVGETRMVSVVLHRNQTEVPTIAVGVFTVGTGSLAGRSVFMDNSGGGNTLKMQATDEKWELESAPEKPVAPPEVPPAPAAPPPAK